MGRAPDDQSVAGSWYHSAWEESAGCGARMVATRCPGAAEAPLAIIWVTSGVSAKAPPSLRKLRRLGCAKVMKTPELH